MHSCNPLNACFIGTGLPEMVIIVKGKPVAISDIPKPQGAAGVPKGMLEFAQKHWMDSKMHRKLKKRRR